eukprot:1144448-Pelagomonas_calceolata.AAC.9
MRAGRTKVPLHPPPPPTYTQKRAHKCTHTSLYTPTASSSALICKAASAKRMFGSPPIMQRAKLVRAW